MAEHYISVVHVISGDFGRKYKRQPREFWGVAWEALYGRVPHWKPGNAPFANFSAIRVRGAILDSVGAHGWHRHHGGESVCHERDEGADDAGFGTAAATDGLSADDRLAMSRLVAQLTGECSPESRAVFAKLVLDRQTIAKVAVDMDRPESWVAARKAEVQRVLADKLTDRRKAAELLEVE